MDTTPQLLVMAAGIGSRYGGLKQIDPVGPNNEIIIDYSIYDAVKAGFKKVVFIINKNISESFKSEIGKHIEKQIEVEYVYQSLDVLPAGYSVPKERTKPLGTAHAILCAKNAITAPFAVINADDFYGSNSYKIIFDFLSNIPQNTTIQEYCMAGYILNNTLTDNGHVARGVCTVSEDGYLESIVERTKIKRFGQDVKFTEDDTNWNTIDKSSIVSMNLFGFTPSFINEIDNRFTKFLDNNIQDLKAEYFMPTVVNEMINEKLARVKVLKTQDKWVGVTYKDDRKNVIDTIAELIKSGVYPKNLR